MGDVPATRLQARPVARPSALAVDVTIACSLALVLGLARLGTPSLWFDEGLTTYEVDLSMRELVARQFHLLYFTLLKPWVAVAGDSEWALRFPSVVGLVLACAFTVMLGHRLFDRRVALASGLLLATSPFLVKWSQQARGYTLLLAAAALATLLLVRALDRGTRASWLVYGAALSLVIVWHAVGGLLLVPAHAVLIAQRRDRVLPQAWSAAIPLVLIAFPWVAIGAARSIEEYTTAWLAFPTASEAAWALLDISGVAGLGLVLALIGIWMLRRVGRVDDATWLAVWALSPFAVGLVVSLVRPIYLDRYLIVAAPAFALLAGVAIVGLARRLRPIAVAAVAVSTFVGLALYYASTDDGNWRSEDWRRAVATVVSRQGEATEVVVVPQVASPVAEYYGVEAAESTTATSAWVIVWSESGGELAASERRVLGLGSHRLVEREDFGRRLSAQLWARERP